ncbi:MAG: plasmid partitioning protein [Collinsella tanakaei]|nr:MAG: plasmid partitioning protein [Collinsella tanakaei]
MAKNFGNAGSMKAVANAKKVEQEKAQVVALQNISNDNLIDNPKNGEDISFTADLEESMKQNGFTDPMEVTDFGMDNGKYMILSGHRRRMAGVKVFGKEFFFPCIVRHFDNAEQVQNYTLMANAQRDSAKDPCLFCARYKLHEEYLESIGFKGSKREEIAKRLGISAQQADRYNNMNKIILPVWDMVRAEIVGISSVQPMAKHTKEEQLVIYNIMQSAVDKGVNLSRDTVKKIVDGFREGKTTWEEIADMPRDSGLPLNGFADSEPSESRDNGESGNRNDEVNREHDPIADELDAMDKAEREWNENQRDNEDGEDEAEEKEKHEPTPEEKALKLGEDIAKQLAKLDTSLQDIWKCKDKESAVDIVINMKSTMLALVDEMVRVSDDWEINEEADKALTEIVEAVELFNK